MLTQLNIPKTIKAGYQTRQNTYSKKLAYVIYYDHKNKLRKETSWQGWIDKTIPTDDFTNEPTTGFVLNKNGGGGRGWDSRCEFIRVYDPRGFEFEISLANLLFILQESTSTKGKGLEGEFVYAWEGSNLVLLPTSCKEYVASTKFTDAKLNKVSATEMIQGHKYLTKNQKTWLYLGRQECKPLSVDDWDINYTVLSAIPNKKFHVFWDYKQEKFLFEKGFTRLSEYIGEEQDVVYSDILLNFMNSKHVSLLKEIVLVEIPKEKIKNSSAFCIGKIPSEEQYQLFYSFHYYHYSQRNQHNPVVILDLSQGSLRELSNKRYNHSGQTSIGYNTIDKDYPGIKLYTLQFVLQSGVTIGVISYVQ
jgi:hypothetical protein